MKHYQAHYWEKEAVEQFEADSHKVFFVHLVRPLGSLETAVDTVFVFPLEVFNVTPMS